MAVTGTFSHDSSKECEPTVGAAPATHCDDSGWWLYSPSGWSQNSEPSWILVGDMRRDEAEGGSGTHAEESGGVGSGEWKE